MTPLWPECSNPDQIVAFAEQARWFAELAVASHRNWAYVSRVQIVHPHSFATGLAGGDLA